MICKHCGKIIDNDSKFCVYCGGSVIPNQVQKNRTYPESTGPSFDKRTTGIGRDNKPINDQHYYTGRSSVLLTKEEFIDRKEIWPLINRINTSATICYVCAALTGILMIISIVSSSDSIFYNLIDPAAILDVILLIVLATIIKKKKSFPASVVLLGYSAISVGIAVYMTGSIGGWLVLIAGIYATVNTWKLEKAWKEYQATEVIPDVEKKKK